MYVFNVAMALQPIQRLSRALEGYNVNWNLVQSSTHMCVECAFGILKGR